ncbi:hypothetical protein HYU13_03065 [Candidatus Woesearchaeota archaeon]|nr:hypothetical protein [Candidatus Woesearchaeota archaeon]
MKRPMLSAVALVLIAIFILSLNFLINKQLSGMEFARFPMRVTISEETKVIGFDVNTSFLAFGRMSAGGSGMRPLQFRNNGNTTQCIKYYTRGAMGRWFSLPNTSFLLPPFSSAEIKANLNTPRGIPAGNYTGEAIFLAKPFDKLGAASEPGEC